MTATDTLPLIVSCMSCKQTYVVPYGSPRFEAERAALWHADHVCVSSELIHKGRSA